MLWSTAALIGAALLHVDRIPIWGSAVLAACAAWQLSAAAGKLPPVPRALRLALTLILVASVLAASLDRQALIHAPLYILEATLCCSALAINAYGGHGMSARDAGLLAVRSLLLAVPLALLMFLFFPRLPGGFWSLPARDSAVTGLGDSMSPGSISELTESYEPVRFAGEPPPAEERYWRGPVLHSFNGYTWRNNSHGGYRQQRLQYLGRSYHYTVTLLPDSNPWWFALDTVAGSPDRHVSFTYDYVLVAHEPVTQATSYEAQSYPHTLSTDPLSNLARREETALPAERNPRTRREPARKGRIR